MRNVTTTGKRFAAVLASIMLLGSVPGVAGDIKGDALGAIHQRTAAQYANVRHMIPGELSALRTKAPNKVLLLDVREPAEHAVSHLAGAVRVSPALTAEEFTRTFANTLKGRTVVLYCSVGVRSSRLASRVQATARKAGAMAVYNLAGGVFNWHNQSRPLTSSAGRTDRIHPYNWRWSRLLERRSLISYKPPGETQ